MQKKSAMANHRRQKGKARINLHPTFYSVGFIGVFCVIIKHIKYSLCIKRNKCLICIICLINIKCKKYI